ncbi:hypothetical protein T10_2449 [Trichinella papuae]|uniref:Uncharacterized protein n=1 Tax=Trichinella papuae TaxID=268474 RepID=A0A0V1MQ62_9BILA|nr:hypothetical protein T10_2449 [Trichinella papuae]
MTFSTLFFKRLRLSKKGINAHFIVINGILTQKLEIQILKCFLQTFFSLNLYILNVVLYMGLSKFTHLLKNTDNSLQFDRTVSAIYNSTLDVI